MATKTPTGLGARGRRFWRDITTEFELSNAELNLLEEACRTLDDLDRLQAVVEELGTVVTGSTGQPVINAALTEARGQRVILHRLIAALQLPAADGKPVPAASSARGSTAARARWRGHLKQA